MNIVLATDDNFVQHCSVTMLSILKHNSDVVFYILTEGLSENNVSMLNNIVAENGGDIYICNVDKEIVKRFPMPADADAHISVATYYRLLTEFILPQSVDKYIYMDCDMVVRGNMLELWNENVEDYAIGAVFQSVSLAQEQDKNRLGIPEKNGYFNAGLLLVNLKYWRENNISKRLLDFVENSYSRIKQHDQDVLNAVLYNEVKPISYTWNYLPQFFNKTQLRFKSYVNYSMEVENPIIIHFVSAPKPWDYGCTHPYKQEYYKYLQMTPFANYRPRFIWRKYYDNILRHKIYHYIILLDVFNLRKKIFRPN